MGDEEMQARGDPSVEGRKGKRLLGSDDVLMTWRLGRQLPPTVITEGKGRVTLEVRPPRVEQGQTWVKR